MRLFHYFCLLFCLSLLVACSKQTQPVFRVATNVWPGYEPLYLARSLGWYENSTLRLVEMPSASQVVHAFRNGTVEAAALTLDETLTLIQDGDVDLRIILVMDISNGADVLLGHANIPNLQALRGKRVAVENTATGAVLLDAALQAAQLQAHEIKLVPKTVNDHLAAWKNGEIDAVVTFEPVRTAILNAGAVELFNSGQIPGRIMDVLVVRADAIQGNETVLKQLVSSYFEACDYLAHSPQDASVRMGPRLGTAAEQVFAQFKGLQLPSLTENRKWLSVPDMQLINTARELAQLMKEHQLLVGNVNLDALVDARFLPEALQ
ncbi:ABC transporter substrate-binding protein [Methylomonas sp. AM2-LC]|uniref:ABC transporter substrate-binding protein n=1 Tax=Methylomonas sp. AM2-LC TaxID=3153301 RepID=UPI0032677BF2